MFSEIFLILDPLMLIENQSVINLLEKKRKKIILISEQNKKSHEHVTNTISFPSSEESFLEIVVSMRVLGKKPVTLEECRSGKKENEDKCGRPLQIKFDARGALFVADAAFGLIKIYSKKYEDIENKDGSLVNDIEIERLANIEYSYYSRTIHLCHHDLF